MPRRRLLWISLGVTLALFAVLTVLDLRMRDTGGPGIIGFEFAWSEQGAAEILADWGEKGQDAARASLWVDFLYLISYALLLTLLVGGLRERAAGCGLTRIAALGTVAIALPSAVASFDAIEDVGLLLALDGKGGDTAPGLAAVCATLKFALLAAVVAYLLVGLIAVRRCERSTPAG